MRRLNTIWAEGSPPARWAIELALGLWLISFGVFVSLYVGRIGYMPMDQSIVFDGGWRLLCGQLPYRDYITPCGTLPILGQGAFFALFGVSWLSYCVHAGVLNGLFCWVVYRVCRLAGLGHMASVCYGTASSVLFYAPFGVPFMDQHAFFFTLVAVWLALEAWRAQSMWPTAIFWALVPLAVVLALLSKQIPTVLALPIILYIMLLAARAEPALVIFSVGVGSLFISAVVGILAVANGITWEAFQYAALRLPAEEGAARLDRLLGVGLVGRICVTPRRWHIDLVVWAVRGTVLTCLVLPLRTVSVTRRELAALLKALPTILFAGVAALCWISRFDHWSSSLLIALILAAASGCLVFVKARELDRASRLLKRRLPFTVIALGLWLTCVAFTLLAHQDAPNCIAYGFVCLGICNGNGLYLVRSSRRRPASHDLWRQRISVAFCLILIFDVLRFYYEVDLPRKVHRLLVAGESEPRVDGRDIAKQLDFMVWSLPSQPGLKSTSAANSFRKTIDYLRRQEANFLLLGHSSILYALTGKPSSSPSLWFHQGLTYPSPNSERFDKYAMLMRQRMVAFDVRFLVLEQGYADSTHLPHTKLIQQCIEEGEGIDFGYFQVILLDPQEQDKGSVRVTGNLSVLPWPPATSRSLPLRKQDAEQIKGASS